MNKRQKVFNGFCESAGLTLVEWSSGKLLGHRIGALCRAPNGATARFSISNGNGDDRRGDLNVQGYMRRFARENCATALSVAIDAAAPAAETAPPPYRAVSRPAPLAEPRVHRRPAAAAPIAPLPAPTPVQAPIAAPAPSPAPSPAPATPPAAMAPTTLALIQKANTVNPAKTAANDTRINRLTSDEVIDLNDWVKATDPTPFRAVSEMAAAATKVLGFEVTATNLLHPLKRNKITHFDPKATPAEVAYELAIANAAALTALAENLGFKLPADVCVAYERHAAAINPPKLKAA